MKIYVDELPKQPNECLFSIFSHRRHNSSFIPNCALRMNCSYDWEGMSFSMAESINNCLMACGKECSFLKVMGKEGNNND